METKETVERSPVSVAETTAAPAKRVLTLAELVQEGTRVETKEIPVPAFGPNIFVLMRVLSASEALRMREELQGPAAKNAMLRMILETALNPDGTRMFNDIEQLQTVGKLNLKAVVQLEEGALELNDLLPEARKKALMEERKNALSGMAADGSPSA